MRLGGWEKWKMRPSASHAAYTRNVLGDCPQAMTMVENMPSSGTKGTSGGRNVCRPGHARRRGRQAGDAGGCRRRRRHRRVGGKAGPRSRRLLLRSAGQRGGARGAGSLAGLGSGQRAGGVGQRAARRPGRPEAGRPGRRG